MTKNVIDKKSGLFGSAVMTFIRYKHTADRKKLASQIWFAISQVNPPTLRT